MTSAGDRSQNSGGTFAPAKKSIPRCICTWKNCRAYQKTFREAAHPTLDGVIKLRLYRNDPEHMNYKACLDRTLKPTGDTREDWYEGGHAGDDYIKYAVARHHYTEKHIQRHLKDPKNYSFTKPFSVHGARKYLCEVDTGETVRGENGELLYLQVPNVPKEDVREAYLRAKEQLGAQQSKKSDLKKTSRSKNEDSTTASVSNGDDILQQKDEENTKLKEQLEAMQNQLQFLHSMVQQLQEEHLSTAKPTSSKQAISVNGNVVPKSSRRHVPGEIRLGEEGSDTWNEPTEEDWSEHLSAESHEERRGPMKRRTSTGSAASAYSKASVFSRATSIISASKSVKSLPREIALDDDDDDDSDSNEEEDSLEQEETVDTHSQASSKQPASRASSHGGPINGRKPSRRMSLASSGASVSSRSSRRTSSEHGGGTHQVTAVIVTDPYGEKGTYTGSISNSTGMPHGYGRLEYDRAGRWYEGDWKHGRWTGQGRLSNGDGDYYEGGLKNDHKHGHGVMRFADGRTFEGEYINGQMIEGLMTYQDGSTYTGSWVDGMRHGRGRCVFTDESIYDGEFREGEFFGYGKMSWSDGGWYEGEWWNGEMHGYGKEMRPDGSLRHDGEWCKGQPIRNR